MEHAPTLDRILGDRVNESGLSLRDLSESTGIAVTTLHRRLKTGRGWTLEEAVLIAAALGVALPDLLAVAS